MKTSFKWSSLSIIFFTLQAVAGTHETPNNQTGLFMGAGGSFNSIIKIESIAIDQASSFQLDVVNDRFAPFAQIGYFTTLSNSLLLGVKGWYKYLDSNLYVYWEAIDNRFLNRLKTPHEFSMMAMLGYMFNDSFMYIGAGSVLFDVTNNIQDFTTLTSSQESAVMWGGAAQADWAYYLSPTWFLDMSYTYAISGQYNFLQTVGTHEINTKNVQIRSQEFVASINKIFSL